VLAFVINILPVPGLDGFGALAPYLPASAQRLGSSASWYAPLILFILIIAVPQVGEALFRASYGVFAALGGNSLAAAVGYREFLFWR
jgi:Zn-dependent protease